MPRSRVSDCSVGLSTRPRRCRPHSAPLFGFDTGRRPRPMGPMTRLAGFRRRMFAMAVCRWSGGRPLRRSSRVLPCRRRTRCPPRLSPMQRQHHRRTARPGPVVGTAECSHQNAHTRLPMYCRSRPRRGVRRRQHRPRVAQAACSAHISSRSDLRLGRDASSAVAK